MSTSTLMVLSERPRLFVAPGFLTPDACDTLLLQVRDSERLAKADVTIRTDVTGQVGELPTSLSPELADLAARIEATLGIENRVGGSLRLRIYSQGEGHPPHLDTYQIAGHHLIATAIVCLHAPERGGETVFLDADGGPIQVAAVAGQLVAWHTVDLTGKADPAGSHLGARVLDGQKVILAAFMYAPPQALADAAAGVRASPALRAGCRTVLADRRRGALRGFGRVLAIVDDGVPAETVAFVRAGCAERGIRVIHINPNRFDFAPERTLRDGDMIYRPAISTHASRVEQHLWHPGVASFYRDPDGPFFGNINANATFAREGLPVPRTFWLQNGDRDLLRTMVEALGGMPVVVKALGHSRGVGVIRADSLPSLFSIVDFALAEGNRPLLTSYIPDAIHWRFVVVGDRAVASYRNTLDSDDFRTSGSSDREDYTAAPPKGGAELAVKSCHVLRHDHGGVDILEHPSGRLYVLESNFPCYYAQAQTEAGVDVGGAMVEYLLTMAEAIGPASTEPIPVLVG